jgi:hypothetical protein
MLFKLTERADLQDRTACMRLVRTLHEQARDLIQKEQMKILIEPSPDALPWPSVDLTTVTDPAELAIVYSAMANAEESEPFVVSVK